MARLDSRLERLERGYGGPERFAYFVFFATQADYDQAEARGELRPDVRYYVAIDPDAI